MFQSAAPKRALAFALAMAFTTVPGTVVAGEMEFDRSRVPAALVGSWKVSVTPYNCVTGATFPQFTRPQLITFGDGGTVVEGSGSPDFQPGQRSPGHGYWERTGPQSFRTVIEAFILFTSVVTPPTPPDTSRVRRDSTTASRCRMPTIGRATCRSRSSTPAARPCPRRVAPRQRLSACASATGVTGGQR